MSDTIKIKIEMNNNSDARSPVIRGLAGLKHNGGKTVIAYVTPAYLATAESILDASHAVRSYEVIS